MKKSIFTFAITLLIAGFTTNTFAQDTKAEVKGTAAGAKLVKPMTLSRTSDLHFGTINVQAGLAGTVVLSTANVRTPAAGVILSTVAPVSKNAAFDVTGTKNSTYVLTILPTITVTETLGATMDITELTIKYLGGAEKPAVGSTSTLATPIGTDSFIIGGKLTIAAAQVPGIYAGTFDVSVDYN